MTKLKLEILAILCCVEFVKTSNKKFTYSLTAEMKVHLHKVKDSGQVPESHQRLRIFIFPSQLPYFPEGN